MHKTMGKNRRSFQIQLIVVFIWFLALCATVVLAYHSQKALQQDELKIREVYGAWNALVSSAKSLEVSVDPLSKTYATFKNKMQDFSDLLVLAEGATETERHSESELGRRLNYLFSSMHYGLNILEDINGWLVDVQANAPKDDRPLRNMRADLSKHTTLTYPELLVYWSMKRIEELDQLFEESFSQMDTALNGIIQVNLKQLSVMYLAVGIGIGVIFLGLIGFFLARLQTINQTLDMQAFRLEELNTGLEQKVTTRTRHLEMALGNLEHAQAQLVASEKLAQLGQLVAGVAHEVNTPLGVAVTAASFQQNIIETLVADIDSGKKTLAAKSERLQHDLSAICEASDIILVNLMRASEIISAFKQLSVDQTGDQARQFLLSEVINQTLVSLSPRLKHTKYLVDVVCPPLLAMDGYPGAISQILANLIQNSLLHGFANRDEGHISIEARQGPETPDPSVVLVYKDDGCGIPRSVLPKIFEPFFTTKRNAGGSGLGLSIVQNLVQGKLKGSLKCETKTVDEGEPTGTSFTITLPHLVLPLERDETTEIEGD